MSIRLLDLQRATIDLRNATHDRLFYSISKIEKPNAGLSPISATVRGVESLVKAEVGVQCKGGNLG